MVTEEEFNKEFNKKQFELLKKQKEFELEQKLLEKEQVFVDEKVKRKQKLGDWIILLLIFLFVISLFFILL